MHEVKQYFKEKLQLVITQLGLLLRSKCPDFEVITKYFKEKLSTVITKLELNMIWEIFQERCIKVYCRTDSILQSNI